MRLPFFLNITVCLFYNTINNLYLLRKAGEGMQLRPNQKAVLHPKINLRIFPREFLLAIITSAKPMLKNGLDTTVVHP